MSRNVSLNSDLLKFAQSISIGPHVLKADEPSEYGGNDEGPTSVELLMAALAACTSITAQMYAERHHWPLQRVHIEVSYSRVPAEDYGGSDAKTGMMDRIEMEIALTGDLSEDQQRRIFDIANRCPVHRMLTSQVQISPHLLTAKTSRA